MKTRLALVAALSALVVIPAFAQEQQKKERPKIDMSPEAQYRRTGGQVLKKGTFTGKVAFIDTQSVVPFEEVQKTAKLFADTVEINVVAEKSAPGKASDLMKASGANVVIVLVNDKDTPLMLLAPEDHWGIVNVAKLVDDLPSEKAKAKFRSSRARKELVRAFSILCGGGSSQFPGNMMNAATLKQLDLTVDTIPMDMVGYYQTYLKSFGVTPREFTTYKKACREGWAAAPTNDVQKAIWDKVHELPTKPIKIEFDPKKDK